MTDELGVVADVAAQLDGGEPLVALLVGSWRSRRSELIKRLCAHLAWNSTRVIRIGAARDGIVDVRCFCDLLVAAVRAGTIASVPTQGPSSVLGGPGVGERSLTLIVEDADALTVEALAFVFRLAVDSRAQPRRIQALLLGSHRLQDRLAGMRPAAVISIPDLNSLTVKQRTPKVLLALAAVGCLAGVMIAGTLRLADNNRLSAKAGSAFEAPPARALPSVVFALGEVSSTPAPSGSASKLLYLTAGQAVPENAGALPKDAAHGAEAASAYTLEPQTATAEPPTESVPHRHSDETADANAELLAQLDALLARRSAGGAGTSDAEITELLTKLDALLARRPAEGAAPPDAEQSASQTAPLEPSTTPPPLTEAAPDATTTAVAPAASGPPAVPLAQIEPSAPPVQPDETAGPSTAVAPAASAALSGIEPSAPPVQPDETAGPSTAVAPAASAALSGTEPSAPRCNHRCSRTRQRDRARRWRRRRAPHCPAPSHRLRRYNRTRQRDRARRWRRRRAPHLLQSSHRPHRCGRRRQPCRARRRPPWRVLRGPSSSRSGRHPERRQPPLPRCSRAATR